MYDAKVFFPLLKVEGFEGFLELSFLPANNWENRLRRKVNIHAIWTQGDFWRSEKIDELSFGQNLSLSTNDLDSRQLESGLCLLYPSREELSNKLTLLPSKPIWFSRIPEWRCTSGLRLKNSQTSYQSELFPLPSKGTMLTFHPFIQYGEIDNYLLVLNLTKEPTLRRGFIDLFSAFDLTQKGTAEIWTNSAVCIPLNDFNYESEDLPLIVSKEVAGIPFGLGVARDKSMLSLEHTHPPASFTLFGNRLQVQGQIKKKWFNRIELRR